MTEICDICGEERTEFGSASEYSPLRLLTGANDPGWYTGDDGTFCGICMRNMFRRANKL